MTTFDQRRDAAETAVERFDVKMMSSTPTSRGIVVLSKADGSQTDAEVLEIGSTPYQEAVGALMWIAATMRSDLSFAAHNVAKFDDNPGSGVEGGHEDAAVHEANNRPEGDVRG